MGKKRKVNKKAKQSKFLKVFIALVVVVLIGGTFAYAHFTYNKDYKDDNLDLIEAKEFILNNIPSEVTDNLDFLDLSSINDGIIVIFKSSNENVINSDGKVTRPSYLSNNEDIELEITLEIVPTNFLANFYYNLLGGANLSFKIEVTVIKLDETNLEKLEKIIDQLFVPNKVIDDFGLTEEILIYDNINITWTSSDEDIVTNKGEVKGLGDVILTAKVEIGEDFLEKDFPLEVVSSFDDIVEVDEDFQAITISQAYDTVDKVKGLIINQSILNTFDGNKFLRMRANSDASIEFDKQLSGLTSLSFKYWAITNSAFGKDVYLYVQTSIDDGATWDNFEEIKIINNDVNNVSVDLSSIINIVKIRILSYADYSEMFIALDDLKLERALNIDDIEKAFNNIIPSSLMYSYVLPSSTPYGGKVNWSSSKSDVLSKEGIINRKDESVVVNMIATVTDIFTEFTLSYDINVVGLKYVTPVEVFFIDLGKYGDADNGESFYFKIGEIDILVDSGDNMNATKQAISEVIDENSEDKVLDYVIATHPDADHIGSMKHVFDTYDVLNVIYFEGTHTTQLYQTFVNSIASEETLVSECTILRAYNNQDGCKRVIELIPEVRIVFLNTNFYETSEPNGRSIVFVFEAYGTRLLMTGDADNGAGRNLESSYMNTVGDINILKVVHHGTKEGTTLEFLNAIKPEYAIISNGNYFGNKHGHPTHEAINRIYQYSSKTKVYTIVGGNVDECTYTTSYKCEVSDRFHQRNGTIKLVIDSSGFTFTSEYNTQMIELSSTDYWKNHPYKQYEYSN